MLNHGILSYEHTVVFCAVFPGHLVLINWPSPQLIPGSYSLPVLGSLSLWGLQGLRKACPTTQAWAPCLTTNRLHESFSSTLRHGEGCSHTFAFTVDLGSPSPGEALTKEHQFSRETEATGSHWSQIQGSECCLQNEMWALGSGSSQTQIADFTSSTFPEHRRPGIFSVCSSFLEMRLSGAAAWGSALAFLGGVQIT